MCCVLQFLKEKDEDNISISIHTGEPVRLRYLSIPAVHRLQDYRIPLPDASFQPMVPHIYESFRSMYDPVFGRSVPILSHPGKDQLLLSFLPYAGTPFSVDLDDPVLSDRHTSL